MAVASEDYYETLGVARDASTEDIRRAYRRLARENHPDVNKEPGAEDRFKRISEAYDVLRDPDKRGRYDRLGASWRAGGDRSGAAGSQQGFDGNGDFGDVRVDFGAGDFGDLFEGFFGRGRRRPGAGASSGEGFSMRGGDQEATLELTLEEAASGGKRRISLGDGRDFEVDVPRGVRDGQRIRLPRQGGAGAGGGEPGDLYLRVSLKPHPRFRVDGRDLYVDLPVAPWEAALGARVPVPTLAGSARVNVPAGSSSGRRLRLRGQGMPAASGSPGDLYAMVSVHVPKRLDKEERELFERLAEVSSFDPRAGLR
ncbi:MAG: curved DNA-binding protein [Solirubrobacteraceae bacterium]|nr:curved DNA-binding protein [Solirubrobacteraceae bacterium]